MVCMDSLGLTRAAAWTIGILLQHNRLRGTNPIGVVQHVVHEHRSSLLRASIVGGDENGSPRQYSRRWKQFPFTRPLEQGKQQKFRGKHQRWTTKPDHHVCLQGQVKVTLYGAWLFWWPAWLACSHCRRRLALRD